MSEDPSTPDTAPDAVAIEEQRPVEENADEKWNILGAVCRRLYISHFLSTWSSRSFEFASVLFLAHLYPGTLLYLSIYAMIRSAWAIVTSTSFGRAIDRHARLPVVRYSISEPVSSIWALSTASADAACQSLAVHQ